MSLYFNKDYWPASSLAIQLIFSVFNACKRTIDNVQIKYRCTFLFFGKAQFFRKCCVRTKWTIPQKSREILQLFIHFLTLKPLASTKRSYKLKQTCISKPQVFLSMHILLVDNGRYKVNIEYMHKHSVSTPNVKESGVKDCCQKNIGRLYFILFGC